MYVCLLVSQFYLDFTKALTIATRQKSKCLQLSWQSNCKLFCLC